MPPTLWTSRLEKQKQKYFWIDKDYNYLQSVSHFWKDNKLIKLNVPELFYQCLLQITGPGKWNLLSQTCWKCFCWMSETALENIYQRLFRVKFVLGYQGCCSVSKWCVCNLIFHFKFFPVTKMQSFSSVYLICSQSTDIKEKNVLKLKCYLTALYCFHSSVNCWNEYMMECMLHAGHV